MKGAAEETLALHYLQQHGLKRLAQNWRAPGGELDLIVLDGNELVIVEVRKRSHRGFADGASSVDARKQARIVKTTRHFLAQHPAHQNRVVRFDVIALDAHNNIEWIRAAFDADG